MAFTFDIRDERARRVVTTLQSALQESKIRPLLASPSRGDPKKVSPSDTKRILRSDS